MRGMNATTGTALTGWDHVCQSIRDILTTPLGTRVQRRDYGSRLFDLIDRPASPALNVEIFAAVAEALDKWEKRFRLERVETVTAEAGRLELILRGVYLPDGKEVTMEGIII